MNYHVTIKYPDNICFVFNPQIVQLSGGLLAGGMSLKRIYMRLLIMIHHLNILIIEYLLVITFL